MQALWILKLTPRRSATPSWRCPRWADDLSAWEESSELKRWSAGCAYRAPHRTVTLSSSSSLSCPRRPWWTSFSTVIKWNVSSIMATYFYSRHDKQQQWRHRDDDCTLVKMTNDDDREDTDNDNYVTDCIFADTYDRVVFGGVIIFWWWYWWWWYWYWWWQLRYWQWW